jgi:mRNA-degrading endonuclease toxin of MazEF toxin-antitoxin module
VSQFEIRRLRTGGLALVLQHDILDGLSSCIVAPVVRSPKLRAMTRLRPTIRIDDADHVVLIDRLAAIDRSKLGEQVVDIRERQDEINLALDFLFKGF